MDRRHDDTDPTNGRDIDTAKASGTLTEPGLRYPRDFLLADERPEDYELNVAALAQDLQPRGALERRQVDLIAVADWEGMRHRRLIAALLHPAQAHLQPAGTPSEHTARQYVEALASVNGKERRPKKNFLPEPAPGDRATTADILRAQRANMAALEFHQRQVAAAVVEDANVVDAVVVEADCASSGGEPSP